MTGAGSSFAPVVILVAVPDAETAGRLSEILVGERMAACVTHLPGATSRYRWQGKLETAAEDLLLIKTVSGQAPEILRRVAQAHPYQVPEILVLPVADGYAPYLEWMRSETAAGED